MQKVLANVIMDLTRVKFDIKVNKCKSMDEIDKSLPTLIIGYKNAKKYIKDFNILKKSYHKQNLWWTFSKTERGVDFQDDIYKFSLEAIDNIIDKVEYQYVDYIDCSMEKTKKILIYLTKSDDYKIAYIDNNNFLYVYSPHFKIVWGFSLGTMMFYGIKQSSIERNIRKFRNTQWVRNFTKIPTKVKRLIGDKIHNNLILYDYF